MKNGRTLTGINIQYPISKLILEGKKTVETRTYPIPEHLVGEELAIIETPGKVGKFQARVVGVIKFGRCFQYVDEKSFYKDQSRHCVSPDSQWKWTNGKEKWGWEIERVKPLRSPLLAPKKKGIVYTKGIYLGD